MSLLVALLLAALSFALILVVYRVPKQGWYALLAALALGLAGYSFQASPGLAGSPVSARAEAKQDGWGLVDLRKEFLDERHRSENKLMVTADALIRNGQYRNAAILLRGMVRDDPDDAEAWLALANALTFHADGMLTPSSKLAFREVARTAPDSAGPAFFTGITLVREGHLIEAHEMWSDRLASMPEEAVGRDVLAVRLAELEELMRRIVESSGNTVR